MITLAQFLFRLSFGLALCMAATSPRQVTSGFFRNHAYVVLGLQTLAAMAMATSSQPLLWLAVSGAVLSYVAAVLWLYERALAGRSALIALCLLSAIEAWSVGQMLASPGEGGWLVVLRVANTLTSGLVLGAATTAMLLGHWYLNTPTMKSAPLFRLIGMLAVAIGLRAAVCGGAVLIGWQGVEPFDWLIVAVRWSFGIVGLAVLAVMANLTLKVPNTQSATGILYVAVIAAFAGEVSSLLLCERSPFLL